LNEFQALGLSNTLLRSLSALGYETPTPIQKASIPIVLDGHDLMGLAQTGTGKTAAFGLPLIQQLVEENTRPGPRGVRALILSPTRELTNQIADSLRDFSKGMRLRVRKVVGGASIHNQIRDLQHGTDILVATPGRLIDLIERRALHIDNTRHLVLDEADQMLDLGFIHSLRKIARAVGTPRQTLLFSATMPKAIEQLAQDFLSDPQRVECATPGKTADRVEQSVHFVHRRGKATLLKELLGKDPDHLSLVFARTKHGAEKLMTHLVASGFDAVSVHGNKSQGQRERAIRAFRNGEARVLVATDVAARGIDIPGVSHVYNFDLPEVSESYVHRIGRTARAGAEGEAISFCSDDEVHLLRGIERLIGIKVRHAGGEMPEGIEEVANNRRGRGNRSNGKSGKFGKPNQGQRSRSSSERSSRTDRKAEGEAGGRSERRRDDQAGNGGDRGRPWSKGKKVEGEARARTDYRQEARRDDQSGNGGNGGDRGDRGRSWSKGKKAEGGQWRGKKTGGDKSRRSFEGQAQAKSGQRRPRREQLGA